MLTLIYDCFYYLGVIDLTNENTNGEDEMQRAIEESLKDIAGQGILGGQVSREEQEISR
jgi:hypothetical protein